MKNKKKVAKKVSKRSKKQLGRKLSDKSKASKIKKIKAALRKLKRR